MKILHICPHLGGGIGTVILGWLENDKVNKHSIICLDDSNEKAKYKLRELKIPLIEVFKEHPEKGIKKDILDANIVVVHFWDHWSFDFLFYPLGLEKFPDCRMVFWCHKNYIVPEEELAYPDLFLDVSPIQGHGRHIWSTGDMSRFREIKPKKHKGFNVGYVGTVDYKKMSQKIMTMCMGIRERIPGARFSFIGDTCMGGEEKRKDATPDSRFTFTGKVDDVAPYLAEMDVFGYPLRPYHYGTCEQVLGEAMSAGIVPVVMANPAEMTIVKHGYNGLVSLTENEYVDNIKLLYDNKKLRVELSENAKVFAKELYSTETMISEWDKVFGEMMLKPKTSKGIL